MLSHLKNKIFLNIHKDYLFSFTNFCYLKQMFFYCNISIDNVVSVKDAKVL